MKIPKKILSVVLCTLLSIGYNQVNLLSANAQEITKSNKSSEYKAQWEVGVRFRLREKSNTSHKDWWEISLVCKNGNVTLNGRTDIPDRFTFDDTFIIGVSSYEIFGPTKIIFKVIPSNGSASEQLKKAIDIFNSHNTKVYDDIYIHGLDSNDSLVLYDKNNIITPLPKSKYTAKYNSKWDKGYKLKPDGLTQEVFCHTPTGVELASRYYY